MNLFKYLQIRKATSFQRSSSENDQDDIPQASCHIK